MPGAKDPREAQISHRLERARLLPGNVVRRQGRCLESTLPAVGDSFSGSLVAEPVADPVRVTGPDDGLNALLHDFGDLREEGSGVVACGAEFQLGCTGAFLIGCLGADGCDYSAGLQIVDVCVWWVWILAWRAYVINVKVADLR